MFLFVFGQDANRALPTDVRWKQVKEGKTDTGLDALFFQYGRYLTIASSRENSPLPIALQGFFNDNKACNMGWTNDYHLDINTEQNYWAADVAILLNVNAPPVFLCDWRITVRRDNRSGIWM